MQGEDGPTCTHGDVQRKGLAMMTEAEKEAVCLQEPGSLGCSGHVKMQDRPSLAPGPADSPAFYF